MTNDRNPSDQWKYGKNISETVLTCTYVELYLEVDMLTQMSLNVASRASYSESNLTINRKQFVLMSGKSW